MVHVLQHHTNGRIPAIEGTWVTVQILGYPAVRQARLTTDDRVYDLVAHGACVRREFDEDAERQAVHLRLQATDIVRQMGWQNRDQPIWKIDTGAALGRLTIHGTVFVDIKAHISNVHTEPHMPI